MTHAPTLRTSRFALSLLSLWMGLFAVGCRETDAVRNDLREVTDDLNRTVAFPAVPERVATLAPSLTEIVFAAGAGHLVVGVSVSDDYPPEVQELPRFDALQMEIEQLLSLRPQLLLGTDQVNSPQKADQLDALGIPTYFFRFSTVESVLDAVERAGDLLGTAGHASRAADSLRAAYARSAASPPSGRRPNVLVLVGDETLYAFGGDSYVTEIIEHTGGRSTTAHLAGDAAVLSEEFVLGIRPEIIILAAGDAYDPGRLEARYPSWRHVPAVREQRVYSIDPDVILRPGPRLTQAAEKIASIIDEYHSARPPDRDPG